MKISIIMIKAFIFSCILKKRQHCLDYGISKERILSDGGVKFGKVNEDQASIHKSNKESINLKLPEAKKVKICPQETMLMIEKNLYTYTKELDKEKNLTNKEKDFLFIDESKGNITSPLKKLENFCTSINMKILFANIEQYMSLHLFGHQFEFYKLKLVNINEIYDFLDENELKFLSYQSIFVPYDDKIYEIFYNICSNHDYDTQFILSSYDIFVSKLISGIFSDKELSDLLIQVGNFSVDDKKVIFYSEFFNCLKYCVIFPELMSLRSFNYQKSVDIMTIFVRFINLYLYKNNNADVIRFFILCVLKKAFNSSYKTSVDFFSIQKLQTDCTKYNYNLNFFLWELSKNKRRDIKQKLKKHDILNFSKSDKIHFKIVLLTFIYQHIICFKYFLVNYEIYEQYYGLIDIIIKTYNCPICDFNKFFELLKKQDQI